MLISVVFYTCFLCKSFANIPPKGGTQAPWAPPLNLPLIYIVCLWELVHAHTRTHPYIYIYKIVDEESQNFIFATNSFTHRTPARASGDCQEDRIQILLHPNKNANYFTARNNKGKGKTHAPIAIALWMCDSINWLAINV